MQLFSSTRESAQSCHERSERLAADGDSRPAWLCSSALCLVSLALVACGGAQPPAKVNPLQAGIGASGISAAQPPAAGTSTAGVSGNMTAGVSAASGTAAPPAPQAGVGSAGMVASSAGSSGMAGASGAAGSAGMMAGSGASGSGGMAGVTAGTGAGSGAAGTGAPAQACTGKMGKLRGESTQMLMAGGLMRSFIYYAPQGIDPNTPTPFVFVPHGFLMSGRGMADITQYEKLADREKIVLVFPDGYDTAWDVGTPTCGSTIVGILPLPMRDEQSFMDAMLKFAEDDQCIDHDHVYMTGFSMGGYFTNHSGCLRKDLRAVAPHSGGSHEFTGCMGGHRPAMLLHFNGDGLIPTMCGTEARNRWVQRNGCEMGSPEVKMVKGGKCEYYKCPADGQVAYCEFEIPAAERSASFPGHAWSGGTKMGPSAQFAIPDTESATELTWQFFKKYAW